MSTMVADHGTHWVVSTVEGPGKRKRMPRLSVRVGKADPDALRAEVIKQAEAARTRYGLPLTKQEPVV